MKIYNKIVYDINNIIEEDSYNYIGPIAKAGGPELMIASAVFSAAATYGDIQTAKAEQKAYEYQLSLDEKRTILEGDIEKNLITERGQKQKDENLVWAVSNGYLDTSRHFLAVNEDQNRITALDKRIVSLNTTYAVGVLQNKRYVSNLKTKNKVFGGYLSIAADLSGGYGKYKHYSKKSTTGNVDYNFDWKEYEQDRS
jgi:hypothetical protein